SRVPIAAMLACAVHQPLDLALREIASLDCQVYGGWSAFSGPRFHRDKAPILGADWLCYTRLLHSGKNTAMHRDRMQDRGGWGRSAAWAAARASRCACALPRGRGDFSDSNFHPDPIPGNLV